MITKNLLKKFMGLGLAILLTNFSNGQCVTAPNGQYPSTTQTAPVIGPLCAGGSAPLYTITTLAYGGEYSVVTFAAQTYVITSSIATDYITITDNAGVAIPTMYGVQPLTVAITTAGTYRIYRHKDAACTAESVSRTIAWGCQTCTGGTFSTTQPATASVAGGTIDVQVLRCDFGNNNCGTVNTLNFSNVSTNVADISTAKVYYTTTSTFSTANLFGTVANPGATFAVSGTQVMSNTTTNYFWLTYDISCNAPSVAANVADASVTNVVSTVGTFTPTTANPTGTRTITALTVSTSQPSTASTVSGAVNSQVLQVNLSGTSCINSITKLNFTNASTNVADIAKARVYYTTTSTFATTTQFGSDVVAPAATFSVSGTLTPATSGTLYFWLVYDIDCAAPSAVSNVADASFTGIVTNFGTLTATTANPTGTRTITVIPTGDNIQNAPTVLLGLAGGNPFDINGKTLQTGEPSPLLNSQPSSTNGSGTSTYSWGTAAGGTQWYKLTVPTTGYGSSGNLLIRGTTPSTSSSGDVQLALWKFPNLVAGGTCSTVPNFTGGLLLGANDDAIVTGTGYTNSSTLNSVLRTRLTPGATYYIQLDGYGAATPSGDLIVEDLADAAGKNVANNGFGNIHNPTSADMRYASYEVIGDDGWTYYYSNNGTSTDITDDIVILGLNWSASNTYLWNGTSATGNDLLNHVRRTATSTTAPSNTAPGSATSTDAFVVWSGRNSVTDVSADLKATAPYVGATISHWWMMNKFWNVFPNQQPTTLVGVRCFYSNTDYDTLNTAITTGGSTALTSHSQMRFLKFTKSATTHYTNAEIDPSLGQAALTAATSSDLGWTNTDAVQTGINRAEFTVNAFSGGGGGGGAITSPLPITLANLSAVRLSSKIVLSWKTLTEVNNAKFDVERSADGVRFNTIAIIATKAVNGNSSSALDYNLDDTKPLAATNYYRLKQTDKNGTVSYSNIVAVKGINVGSLVISSIFPNPATDQLTASIQSPVAGNVTLIVLDIAGKTIKQQNATIAVGDNRLIVDVNSLPSGSYLIKAICKDGCETSYLKFTKQ